jgi:membrane-bound serine protease (ClpP class)
MLVGAYLEAQSPGLIFPGTLAAVSLTLLLAGPFFAGMGEFWHLLVIALGLGMLIYELFAPHFGVVGILGIVFMLVGLVLSIVPTAHGVGLPAAEMWGRLMQSVIWAMAAFVFSAIAAGIITHYMGALPVFRRLVHHNPRNMAVHDAMGAAALSGAGIMSEPVSGGDAVGQGMLRAGMTGQTTTQLRPGGRAMIGDAEIDVETLGSWVDVGAPVRVIEVAGNRIVVEKI